MDQKKVDAIVKSFTDDQAKLYNSMFGDEKKLKADWTGCRKMYHDAYNVLSDKQIGPEVRLFLRNITDYWSRRKDAMERLLKATGHSDLLDSWRKEENGQT